MGDERRTPAILRAPCDQEKTNEVLAQPEYPAPLCIRRNLLQGAEHPIDERRLRKKGGQEREISASLADMLRGVSGVA